jgi:uncharacterized short protein YbdD (DUF466 family)
MTCLCFNLNFSQIAKRVRETAHLMVGVPDYDSYLAHMAANHLGVQPMNRESFWREREAARFGEGRTLRCC